MAISEARSLAGIGWLSRQPEGFRARILAMGRWSTVKRGWPIYSIDDASSGIVGVEDGLVDIKVPISVDEEVIVHRGGPGFWIGDSGLLAGAPRTVSLVAAADSRLLILPAAKVLKHLDAHPVDWKSFAELNHINGSLAVQSLAEVLALPPTARFARLLARLADAAGFVRATQEELGSMAGMSRAAFRRAFGELLASGAVRQAYGGVQIRDRSAIDAAAVRR